MRVFISSVTYALKDERAGLAAILSAVGPYEPLRFEDFEAQDRSSRDACILGVKSSDVYVLLLGPKYGDPLPDSGLAPTEEEFRTAKKEGKPILAFVKITDEADEPRQAEFKAEVEGYVNGRFRGSFRDVQELNVGVLEALRGIELGAAPVEWQPVDGVAPAVWIDSIGGIERAPQYAPVLQVQLGRRPPVPLLASELDAAPSLLTRRARADGFFDDFDGIDAGTDADAAWAIVPEATSRNGGWGGRSEHTFRGIVRLATGSAITFETLPTDGFGALVDKTDLTSRASRLLRAAASAVGAGSDHVTVAARLGPLDRVQLGDPTAVGGRNTASIRMTGRDAFAEMPPAMSVPAAAVVERAGDVAVEIATTLIRAIR